MKHYVLGFIYNTTNKSVLLVEKKRPEWMAGRWNGIGGKVEPGETHSQAMERECEEEIGKHYFFQYKGLFVCPGGTVFVFSTTLAAPKIAFDQVEDEMLKEIPLDELPDNIMGNLKWIIPLCLADIDKFTITQNTYGVD